MSHNTYIAMQDAIQTHMQSGGTINEVVEALRQSVVLEGKDGAYVEAQMLSKLLLKVMREINAALDEIH